MGRKVSESEFFLMDVSRIKNRGELLMNIEHVIDPDRGADFVIECLEGDLGLSLSKYVCRNFLQSETDFFSFASNKLNREQILNFAEGGKFEVGDTSERLLECFISKNCKRNGMWIVEDWLARPKDQFLIDMEMPFLTHENEVYYFVRDANKGDKWLDVMNNRPPEFHAFYGDFEIDPTKKQLDHGDFENISKSIEAIVLGVYDAESFLVCRLLGPKDPVIV